MRKIFYFMNNNQEIQRETEDGSYKMNPYYEKLQHSGDHNGNIKYDFESYEEVYLKIAEVKSTYPF
jgi:hypothetical protein